MCFCVLYSVLERKKIMHFKPQKKLKNSRILLTNDDGIDAPGIKKLEQILSPLSKDIWVVAPLHEKSGAGHSLTSDKLRSMLGHSSVEEFPNDIHKISERHYAVDGTPTDCMRIALNMIMPDNYPDLIISGINNGRNIADDITYSGTVGAAIEGIMYGIPSIAMSQLVNGFIDINWQIAEKYLLDIVQKVRAGLFSADTLININFPNIPLERLSGIAVCRQGTRRFISGTVENRHLCATSLTPEDDISPSIYPDDNEQIHDKITVTALSINMTDDKGLDELARLLK